MAGRRLRIAIVGAGPAGLATALFLLRQGHDVVVHERFETPKPLGSGLILQPTGLTVLAALGLLPQILALGSRIDRLFGADATSGRPVLDLRYDALPRGRFGLAVHRAALFGVLHRAVLGAGIPVNAGIDVQGLERDGDSVALVSGHGRVDLRFDLVVDASGARSRLRALASAPREPRPLPYGAFWATLDWVADGFDPHALLQRYRRASTMVGVMPIGSGANGEGPQAAFFWSLKPTEAEAVRARGLEAWKADVRSVWPQTSPYLDQITDFDQLTLARYGHHTLPRPAGPQIAFVGDSAHSASPQLGQGANMALLDAAALAHALATNPDVPRALDAYCMARRRHIRLFQALSYAFTPFYQSDSSLLPIIRDRVVAVLSRIPPAPQLLAAMVAGTLVDPFPPSGLAEVRWRDLVPMPPRTGMTP